MDNVTNPALWVAIAGVITAIGGLLHSMQTRSKLANHVESVASNPPPNLSTESEQKA